MKLVALIACAITLAGCGPQSLLMPGKSPREAITAKMSELIKKPGVSEKMAACVIKGVNDGLTDAEMVEADRLIASGSSAATIAAVATTAAMKCVFP